MEVAPHPAVPVAREPGIHRRWRAAVRRSPRLWSIHGLPVLVFFALLSVLVLETGHLSWLPWQGWIRWTGTLDGRVLAAGLLVLWVGGSVLAHGRLAAVARRPSGPVGAWGRAVVAGIPGLGLFALPWIATWKTGGRGLPPDPEPEGPPVSLYPVVVLLEDPVER